MPHCFGKRSGTRDLFSKKFRQHGPPRAKQLMTVFHRGDLVDIRSDPSVQKGLPYKYYHGKTGKIFNITPHGVGVIVNKKVRGRIIPKRIMLRAEHVKISKCREDFLRRVRENDQKRRDGYEGLLKRLPEGPRDAHFVTVQATTVVDQKPPVFVENY